MYSFGQLRTPNVIYSKNESKSLVYSDFDWLITGDIRYYDQFVSLIVLIYVSTDNFN